MRRKKNCGRFKRLGRTSHRENMDVVKKVKPYERNWISTDISTKQCYKDQSYLSNNR